MVSPSDDRGDQSTRRGSSPNSRSPSPPLPSPHRLPGPTPPPPLAFSASPSSESPSRSYFHFQTLRAVVVCHGASDGQTREKSPPTPHSFLPKLPFPPQSCKAHSCANPAAGGMQMAVIVCPRMGLPHLCSFSSSPR